MSAQLPSSTTLFDRLLAPGLMRVLLALTVVLYHMSRLELGLWAVYVFFVLSGYWVTLMYLRKYNKLRWNVASFYLSRLLRLLPVYVLCQSLFLLVFYLTKGFLPPYVNAQWLYRVLLIVGSSHQPVLLGPAWSLDVEAQFYLSVPFVVFLLSRFTRQLAARLAWCGAALLLPVFLFLPTYPNQAPWIYSFGSFFLLGVAQAYAPQRPSRKAATASVVGFLSIIILTGILGPIRGLLIGGKHPVNPALLSHNDQYCCLLALIFLPCLYYSLSLSSSRADRTLGNLAYPIYLSHWIGQKFLVDLELSSRFASRLLDLALVAIASCMIEYWVDRPLELRREALMAWMQGVDQTRLSPERSMQAVATLGPLT